MGKTISIGWKLWMAVLILVPMLIFLFAALPNLLDSGLNGAVTALISGLAILLVTATALRELLRKRKRKAENSEDL